MSHSSDEELGREWIPYSERNDFADVTPIKQDDGEHPIVSIAYSAKFREVYDYFRGILASGEKSARALEITTDALHLNTGNYTVWQYRRDILREIGSDLKEELKFLEEMIRHNAKNYQVWHHRRVIVEMLKEPSQELNLTEMALDLDPKNYHAWQHRQWAIRTFNLYDKELEFVDRLISEDIRNNSAWNERFMVVSHFGLTPELIQRELQFAMNRIRVVKNNESAWNYLIGIIRNGKKKMPLYTYPEVVNFSEGLYNSGIRAAHLLAFLIDLYSEQCLSKKDDNAKYSEELSLKVYALCDDLTQKHDVIRRKYWQYLAEQLKHKLNKNLP